MIVEAVTGPKIGLTDRAEQLFERTSSAFVVLMGLAWAFSIAAARATGDKVNVVTPATASVVNGLSSIGAPTAAYLGDAVNKAVVSHIESDATGESGKLLAEIRAASGRPGIVKAAIAAAGALKRVTDFSLITLRPASDVRHGHLGLYFIGSWPRPTSAKGGHVAYDPPSGFIEVTPANEDTRLSEHFRVRDFLTHDQSNVWPKYVVISMKLVDKLELVLADLKAHGINPEGVHVMSGFRTPQYNRGGGDPSGRASLSRHMYGDAADIYIDNTGSGEMSDLNHDGRVDIGDARVILASVNRVEAAHPSLVGGCGIYVGNGAHGPFVHIDTRGYPARWTGTGD
ncbi:MAG TPA: D-Ala-D-Ala carboxypeptidase family metallohydrolase [Gemmatimonadaceae bacterium]